ncbi:hypothetical protein C8R46DRAFT_870522, partial [Mycena filopes]
VRWAPGHVGIIGNERADEEAKRAAQQQDSSPLGSIPLPLHGTLPWSKSAVRQRLNAELKRAVERQWQRSLRYARTMQYDPRLLKGSYLAIAD